MKLKEKKDEGLRSNKGWIRLKYKIRMKETSAEEKKGNGKKRKRRKKRERKGKKKKRRGKLGLDIKKQEFPRERHYRLEKVVSGLRISLSSLLVSLVGLNFEIKY